MLVVIEEFPFIHDNRQHDDNRPGPHYDDDP